jgi:hypothetical protein
MSKRVGVYARVSTTRQAENDISIPDQLAMLGQSSPTVEPAMISACSSSSVTASRQRMQHGNEFRLAIESRPTSWLGRKQGGTVCREQTSQGIHAP